VDGSPLDGSETWHDLDSANPTVTLTTLRRARWAPDNTSICSSCAPRRRQQRCSSFPATVTVADQYSISIDTCDLYFDKDVAATKTLAVSGCLPEGAEASIGNYHAATGFKLDSWHCQQRRQDLCPL
jgi:hypothetical protein